MPSFKNLAGGRFGRLTAIERRGTSSDGRVMWRCACDCGAEKDVRSTDLTKHKTVSCGCYQRDITAARNRRHGQSGTPAYIVWGSMIQRCTNPKASSYPRYGGAGICVCDRWRSFDRFLSDMGEMPAGMTLERIKNAKGYEPGNCKWATSVEQANNKTNNVLIDVGGVRYTASQAQAITGIPATKLRGRVRKGVRPDRIAIDADLRTVAYRLNDKHELVEAVA